jgi:hypothetical protein
MKEDRMAVEKLARIAEDSDWAAFEVMTDGRLLLHDRAQTILPEEEGLDDRPWLFEMRVGLHLDRPTQAIMSCGHFVRIRRDERWGPYHTYLQVLDPAFPNRCLYTAYGNPAIYGNPAMFWHPQILSSQSSIIPGTIFQGGPSYVAPGNWTTNNTTPYANVHSQLLQTILPGVQNAQLATKPNRGFWNSLLGTNTKTI